MRTSPSWPALNWLESRGDIRGNWRSAAQIDRGAAEKLITRYRHHGDQRIDDVVPLAASSSPAARASRSPVLQTARHVTRRTGTVVRV